MGNMHGKVHRFNIDFVLLMNHHHHHPRALFNSIVKVKITTRGILSIIFPSEKVVDNMHRAICTKECGSMENGMALEFSPGVMVMENIQDNGRTVFK